MADIVWPSGLPNPTKAPVRLENPAITSKFESGTVASRPQFTRIRRTWNLNWSTLRNEHYEIMENFYQYVGLGGSIPFKWTHPLSGKVYTVRFKGEFQGDTVSDIYHNVDFAIEEV